MRWFGETWDAPINEETPHAPTPIGRHCRGRCKDLIEEGDRGILIPAWSESKPDHFGEVPYHLRCWLVSIIGEDMTDEILDEQATLDALHRRGQG